MKKLLLFLITIACIAGANAQSKGYDDNDTITLPGFQTAKPTVKDRVHFGVSMGTSVSFARGQDAVMGHFIAPTLSYQVNNRFTLTGGIGIQYNSLNNPWTYGNGESGSSMMLMRPRMQTLMFVRGEYALNPKLTLTGSVFANTAAFDIPGLNPQTYNLNNYGASGGFWYKINDKASFGAEVQLIRGKNPYRDPYQRNMPGGMMGGFDGPANPFGIWY